MDRRVYDNYVIQIVKHGNLSKAALHLGISQPALSSGLNALESELGFRIFNRKRVPITFTAEGEIYYDYINKMQVLSDDFQQRLTSYREEVGCKVTIGGPVAYVESMVTDAIIKLRKENANGTMYNMVGFQTNLKFGEQKRVFSLIPALKNAEYVRYGVMHRNSFLNSPKLLNNRFCLKNNSNIYFDLY